jgi:hypothetical protein
MADGTQRICLPSVKRRNLKIASLALYGVALTAFASDGNRFLTSIEHERADVRWVKTGLVKADFNGDGKLDAAAVGYSKQGIVLAVGIAHDGWQIQYLEFGIGQDQSAICATPARLSGVPLSCSAQVGTLPGCIASPRASGLVIKGGDCDPINVYWNHDTHHPAWWRN